LVLYSVQKYYVCISRLTYLLTYSLTHSRTWWIRVLLEKLTNSQLVKKFPTFYGSRRLITAFIIIRHLFLSCTRLIQSMPPIPLSEDPSYYYLPIYAWVSKSPQVYPPKPQYSPLPHTCYIPRPSHYLKTAGLKIFFFFSLEGFHAWCLLRRWVVAFYL
jgi:hypothetical protein